ncbi:MAG: hypothetical protein ABI462_02410 [Ignavibacteria bacterium]
MEDALQYTQLAVNIIIILLFIMLVILASLLIKSVKNITAKFEELTMSAKDLKPKVEATIEKINSLSDNVDVLVTKVNNNVDVVATIVDRAKFTADSIFDFEKKIQSRIEPPVMDTLNTIAAVSVGIKTFIDKLKSTKKKKTFPEDKSFEIEINENIDEVNQELDEINSKLTDL